MSTQGKSLSVIEKEIIVTLKKYFDRTRDDPQEQATPGVQRVVNALGVSIATVKRVMANHKRGMHFEEQKDIYRGRLQLELPNSMQTVTREYVRTANREGKHVAIELLFQHIKELDHENEFSVRTLGRALDRWGFTFGKGARAQQLKEKDHVVAALAQA
jgi:hypothetical protein